MIGAYLLGVITLPVLAAVVWGLLIAFSRSDRLVHGYECDWCAELGWPVVLPTEHEHRLRIAQWVADGWHSHVRARRLPHRLLWQAHFDKHPGWMRYPDSWKKFGTHYPISKPEPTSLESDS